MSAHGIGAPATGAPGASPAAGSPTDPSTPGQAPATGAPGAPAAPATGTPGQPPEELGPQGLEALRREREARNTAETELKRYRDAEEAQRQGALTETQRLQEQLDTLQREREEEKAKARADLIKVRAEATAARLGFHAPADAVAFLKPSDLEWDDSKGEPKDLDAKLAALAKDKPYLVKAGGAGVKGDAGRGTSGGAGGQPTMNDLIRGRGRN